MKKIIIIVGAVVIAVAIAGASFYVGMAYQRTQVNTVRDRFLTERGIEGIDPGANPGGANFQERGFFGGGTTGLIKSIEGNVITVSTPQDVTTVNLTDSTKIEIPSSATLNDLQPGYQVMVTGERDADGNITASQILILNTNPPDAGTTP